MENCLRIIRREHNETQEQLANAVRASRQTINSIEKGHVKRPSDELMIAIAKHYKKPVNQIFFTPLVRHIVQKSAEVS